jgi:hypothetical protein
MKLVRAACIAPFLLFVVVYVPAAGHGFIKDDYSWILNSRVRNAGDVVNLFSADNGFYRPIVALTFAIDEQISGAHAIGYGLTNVVLALLCCWAIVSLARALNLPGGAALFAGALWLLNFHGIRMAVLWVSGRTSLVLTLAATLAAAAVVRRRLGLAALCVVLALFSKEEAVLLPIVLLAWLVLGPAPAAGRKASILVWVGVFILAEGLYFFARSSTNAMTVSSAPWFYTPTFDVGRLLQNIGAYADRVATLPVAVVLIALMILGRPRPWLDHSSRSVLLCGAIWVVGGLGITLFMPVRSDLYAVLPSVGACLMAAVLCARLWEFSTPVRRTRGLVVMLALLLVLTPVYLNRTRRWVSLAEFGAATLADLAAATSSLPPGATVVIEDDRTQRANMSASFGTLLDAAYLLTTGRSLTLWVEPPDNDAAAAGLKPPCATCVALRLKVVNGRLVRPVQ